MGTPVGAPRVAARWLGSAAFFAAALTLGSPGARASDPVVPSPEGTIQTLGGDLYAGGSVPGAAARPEVRERLDAGLPVTFTFRYRFFRPRRFWFDRSVAARTIARTVSYDPLSALWKLENRVNDGAPTTDWTRDRSEAERFLEHVETVNLGPASMDRPTAAGVKAQLRVHLFSASVLFVPWNFETGWREIAIIPEAQ